MDSANSTGCGAKLCAYGQGQNKRRPGASSQG